MNADEEKELRDELREIRTFIALEEIGELIRQGEAEYRAYRDREEVQAFIDAAEAQQWIDEHEDEEQRYNHNHDSKGRFASASGGSCDWTGADPQRHSTAELSEIVEYAASKGIQIYNPRQFDGDIEVLREQIDVIKNLKDEWGINQKITISFADMRDDDFAETINRSIMYNKKIMRNREVTNKNLNSDNMLSADDIKGITVHEMGHIISSIYGDKGLDIAKETYYNIYNKSVSDSEICQYLFKNVSQYSSDEHEVIKGTINVRHITTYPEITPEVLSKNMYGKKDEFSAEYVRILKGRCSR